jgi:hypothetical protein
VVYDGTVDPAILEAYACREALDLSSDLHIRKLHISSVCLSLLRRLTRASLLEDNA